MSSENLFTQCKFCKKMVSKSAKRCPACGKKINKLTAIHWIGISFLVLIAIGMVNSPNKKNSMIEKVVAPLPLEEMIQLDYSWNKQAFGSVMEVDLVITNNNKVDIKDIQIECNHFAKSGTEIDSNKRIIYEVIKHGSKKKFQNFNMGFIHSQTVKSSCFVKKVSKIK